uniref:Small EDRK-rich factor-like N-terminal domain-containing protein n=2 Tax=Manihot esculenta TaxID=3983 RepID=A0A2C9W7I3_MANES
MVMSYSHPRYPTSDWNIYGTKRSLKTSSVWFLSIFYATKLTFLGLATSSNKGRKILCLSFLCSSTPIMTRGNQRERDRERSQSRSSGKGSKGKDDGLTPEQRRERDAKALQEKAAKKAAQASAGGEPSGGKGKNDKK